MLRLPLPPSAAAEGGAKEEEKYIQQIKHLTAKVTSLEERLVAKTTECELLQKGSALEVKTALLESKQETEAKMLQQFKIGLKMGASMIQGRNLDDDDAL